MCREHKRKRKHRNENEGKLMIFLSSSLFPLNTLKTDINECEIDNGNCSNGTCVNTNGSFYCSCHKGFAISEDDRYKCIRKYFLSSKVFPSWLRSRDKETFSYHLVLISHQHCEEQVIIYSD